MKPSDLESIHPFGLSNRADCGAPDSDTSPGAQWLLRIASDLAEHLERGYEISEDYVHEAADSAVPVYTHERWLVFVDVAGYEEDLNDFGHDRDLTELAGLALYVIAERLLSALIEECVMSHDPSSETGALDWYKAESSDATHPDVEVDLAKIGNPGGAEWAYAATEGNWAVLDRWLHGDATILASGQEASQDEAKRAVEAWVKAHQFDGTAS